MEIKENLKTGDQIDAQLCTYGEVPNTSVDGEELMQKFTRDGFERLIANWKDGGAKPIRVDIDHESELTDKTEAAGWIEDLWTADDGLYGKITISELGAEKLNGLNYRYGSPAFVLDDSGEPVEMTSFALTNRPRLKEMKPVWNFAEKNEEIALNAETTEVPVNTGIGKELMQKLIELLGLPAEATEDDILAAVAAILAKATEDAEKKAEEEKAAIEDKLEEEAIEALDGCDVSEEDKDKVVDFYKKDPETARLIANAFKTKKTNLVVNFEEAEKPELNKNADFQKQLEALPGGQARVDFILNYSKSK